MKTLMTLATILLLAACAKNSSPPTGDNASVDSKGQLVASPVLGTGLAGHYHYGANGQDFFVMIYKRTDVAMPASSDALITQQIVVTADCTAASWLHKKVVTTSTAGNSGNLTIDDTFVSDELTSCTQTAQAIALLLKVTNYLVRADHVELFSLEADGVTRENSLILNRIQ